VVQRQHEYPFALPQKKWTQEPSFRRHGFCCCPAAQHYPKNDYELLPRGVKGK